jgi:hypothetical protein
MGILISLVVGEFFSTLIAKAPPVRVNLYHEYFGWHPRPGAAGWDIESSKFVKKSKTGFHDLNLDNSSVPNCTINFFGDSMTEGFQFSAEKNFSTILESKLSTSSSCTEFRVNNFGLSGTGTFQQSRMMEVYGKTYPAARSAIFLFIGNDLANNLYSEDTPYKPGILVKDDVVSIIESKYNTSFSKIKNFIAYLSDFSNLTRLLIASVISLNFNTKNYANTQDNKLDLKNMGIMVIREDIQMQLQALEKSLSIAKQISENQSSELTIFLIPTGEEVAYGDNQFVSKMKSKISLMCNDLSIRCIDLLPKMATENLNNKISLYHLNGIGHLSLKGHEKIASILINYYKN